jgi:hypothetical protein
MAEMVTVAGIDVSKHWLDITLWPDQTLTLHLDRGQQDWSATLAQWLTDQQVRRVGLEASGGYEIEVMPSAVSTSSASTPTASVCSPNPSDGWQRMIRPMPR